MIGEYKPPGERHKKKREEEEEREGENVRVLVDEFSAVVDLVVDHDEDVLLGVVGSNILVGELLVGRHGG